MARRSTSPRRDTPPQRIAGSAATSAKEEGEKEARQQLGAVVVAAATAGQEVEADSGRQKLAEARETRRQRRAAERLQNQSAAEPDAAAPLLAAGSFMDGSWLAPEVDVKSSSSSSIPASPSSLPKRRPRRQRPATPEPRDSGLATDEYSDFEDDGGDGGDDDDDDWVEEDAKRERIRNKERSGRRMKEKKERQEKEKQEKKTRKKATHDSEKSDAEAALEKYRLAGSSGLAAGWSVIGGFVRWLLAQLLYILCLLFVVWLGIGVPLYAGWRGLGSLSTSLSAPLSLPVAAVCRLPGLSALPLPFCGPHRGAATMSTMQNKAPVELDEMMNLQLEFEGVMDSRNAAIGLPWALWEVESAWRDLRQLVKYSSLPSKQELEPEISGHIEALTKAARRTMVFNVHLDHAMDTILSTTRWTLRVLGDLAAAETSQGALASAVGRLRTAVGLRPAGEAALLRQYVRHMDAVAAELDRAILEAQELLLQLEHMQVQLDDIHGLVRRDTGDTAAAHAALMTTSLWTWLGLRNRARVADVRQRLALLAQLGRHRKAAMQHVAGTLLRLAEIRTRLAELRERAGTRELEGDLTELPLRLHMEVMQSGLRRLEASRQTAEKVKEDFLLHKRGGKADPFG